jgi:Sel1 repeat
MRTEPPIHPPLIRAGSTRIVCDSFFASTSDVGESMKFSVPWTVKGVRPEARATAREAAQRSGMSVGDWLNSAILGQVEDDFCEYGHHDYNSRDRELALIRQRLDHLAGRLEDTFLKKTVSAPSRNRDDVHHIRELIDLFERRLDEFSHVSNETQASPQKMAPSLVPSPAFDRTNDPITPPVKPSPSHDLSGLEEQLRQITDQLEALRHPSAETISALRSEFDRLIHAVHESLPRQAIGAIASQLQKLYECVTDNRQTESNSAALVRIESGLTDLRSALLDHPPTNLKQIEDDIATLHEMITHVASDESVKSLAIQARDLSDKVDQIQQIYISQTAASIEFHEPLQPHTESTAAPKSCTHGTLSPPAGDSARFIAAARRAARTSSRETNVSAPFINVNARTDDNRETSFDSIETSLRPRKLMTGIKFLFAAASIVAIVIGSMELVDHVALKNFTVRVLGSTMIPAAPDMAVKQDTKQDTLKTDPNVKQPTLPANSPPQNTQAAPLEERQNETPEATKVIAPSFLPTSSNLFDTTALSHVSELIQGAPSLFDPPISTPASTRQSGTVGSAEPAPADAHPLADAHPSASVSPPIDELPPAIGGERLRKAAMAGDPAAAYIVAQRYAEGRGVPINLEEAARWYKRAASDGLAPAQFRYATMLEKGQGVAKNLAQARQFYLAAAAKGDAKSMHNLAVLYAQGIDGKPDYANAVVWFRKAASHGIADSQFNLALLTERGLGAEEDLVEAYKWFALAAAHGDHEAGSKRDEIATELDPQQLTAAQESVKAFAVKPQPKQALVVPAPAGGWDGDSDKRPSQSKPPTNRPMVLGAFKIDNGKP